MATFLKAFDSATVKSAIANLSQNIAINGVTVAATFRYEGRNASGAGWTATAGTNLLLGGAGTDPTYDKLTPMTDAIDRGVKINAGKSFVAADAATYDITDDTIDLIYECVFRADATAGESALFGKYKVGDAGPLLLFDSVGNKLMVYGVTTMVNAGNISRSAWYHFIMFCDRNGFTRAYLNGVATATAATIVTGLTTTAKFCIGSYNDGISSPGNNTIALVQGWHCPADTIGSAAEQSYIAKARFAQLTGCYPQVALGVPVPTTMSRGTAAYLERVTDELTDERNLFYVGANWPRLVKIKELTGGQYITGLHQEPTITNLCLQSEDFGTTWTPVNLTSVSTNAIAAPNLEVAADGIVADVTNTFHNVSQSVTLTANTYTFSVFAKKGNQNYVGVYVTGAINNGVMFDLQNGTVGNRYAASANVTGAIENYGNGWYRCSITFTGTAAAYSCNIYASDADWSADSTATHTFSGDAATVNTYLWGAQVNTGIVPPSFIPTTTISAQRFGDLFYFSSDNLPFSSPVYVEVKYLLPNIDATGQHGLLGIGLNTSTGFGFQTEPNDQQRVFKVEGTVSGGVDVFDGEIHTGRVEVDLTEMRCYQDGVLSGTVSPVWLDPSYSASAHIQLGAFGTFTNTYGNILSDLVIENGPGVRLAAADRRVTLTFDESIALAGPALVAANWLVSSPSGVPAVTVTGVAVDGRVVTLTTTEQKNGASYNLSIPQYPMNVSTKVPVAIDYTQSFTGVGVVPYLVAVRGIDARTIEVTFSEEVNESDALTASNYEITAGGSVSVLSVTKVSEVTYRLTTTEMAASTAYTIQASNVRDKAGNPV